MSSIIRHQTIQIQDDFHRLTRQIDFEGLNGPLETDDIGAGMGLRDLWDLSARLQLDLDVRFDWTLGAAALVPSPRVAVRYALDDEDRTIIKASVGRFVGLAPLGALAFSHFPARTDSSFDPETGALLSSVIFRPSAATLDLPRADGVALEVEHRIRPDHPLRDIKLRTDRILAGPQRACHRVADNRDRYHALGYYPCVRDRLAACARIS
jgi:hypothetical protein